MSRSCSVGLAVRAGMPQVRVCCCRHGAQPQMLVSVQISIGAGKR